ncbi:MAG: metal-binding protein [Cyclobacteriaceae bacterium]|nr:metal-binding protein [Cyclobacteriaceae bacterium]
MIPHKKITRGELVHLLKNKKIILAGNSRLKIYGTLSCLSGKRMKRINRVFFRSQKEATEHGYRPCGHCLKIDYATWKKSKKQVESDSSKHQF